MELTQFSDGPWGVRVPLSIGAFVYNFRVTDAAGTQKAPGNPTLWNTATNVRSLSSMVYVGYDADKTGTGKWAGRVENVPSQYKSF